MSLMRHCRRCSVSTSAGSSLGPGRLISEVASVEATFPPSPDLMIIGITASGKSAETIALLAGHSGLSRTFALTNDASASLPAQHTVLMRAGVETGGVACRTYLHTLIALLALEQQLAGVKLRLDERIRRRRAADGGSRFDGEALKWMIDRHSHVVTVGTEPDGVAASVRYPGDDDPIVALLTEVLVAELLAAHWWQTPQA